MILRNCLQCGVAVKGTKRFCGSCLAMRMKPASHNFKAASMGIPGTFTFEEWVVCQQENGNVCLRCGLSVPLTPDHVMPLSVKGSTNYISNIQPLCLECNMFKHTEFIDYRSEDVQVRQRRWEHMRKERLLETASLQERTFEWISYGGRNVKVLVFPDHFEVTIDGSMKLKAKDILPLDEDFIREHADAAVVSKIDRMALTQEQEDILSAMKNKLNNSRLIA